MNWFLGALVGYVIHDAVQPTVVGEILDKISLPSDLLVTKSQNSSSTS